MNHKPTTQTKGAMLLDAQGAAMAQLGVAAEDSRLKAVMTDQQWLREASERRIVPIQLTDAKYVAILLPFEAGHLALLFEEPSETVVKFLLGVDFAFDIINHILTDPFDAMAVIDDEERLVFISPVHEKFFGLRAGEGVGQHVKSVIDNTRLHHVVRTGVAEIGQIQKMKGRERVVSRHPIRRPDGQVVGAIGRVMFKGPQQVEALAKRINALEQQIATYRSEAEGSIVGAPYLDAIIGTSSAIQSVRQQIRKIAALELPVLVQGESGTGKELVAQALHMLSPRHTGRLVSVNAAALPASLVESELFGYEAGAFTGADRKGRAGKFEQAHKGTIFLDEIGDMPLEVQSKLLRVLEDRVVERVGGDRSRKIDFRLCSATNCDLAKLVDMGKFRLDLFYRISPVAIVMPPLADRVEDIPLLLEHFLKGLAEQYGRDVPEVSTQVADYLMSRSWPGNVRELRHVVERAFVFSENNMLRIEDFNPSASPKIPVPVSAKMSDGNAPDSGTLRNALEKVERDLLAEAMLRFNGNKKKVAEHLGISRSYLYKIL